MLDNVGLRYPHRASGAKAPRTLRPLPLLRFAVSATGGAHLCSIQYYLRFWLSICRTSLAVSALRIMRYCPNSVAPSSYSSFFFPLLFLFLSTNIFLFASQFYGNSFVDFGTCCYTYNSSIVAVAKSSIAAVLFSPISKRFICLFFLLPHKAASHTGDFYRTFFQESLSRAACLPASLELSRDFYRENFGVVKSIYSTLSSFFFTFCFIIGWFLATFSLPLPFPPSSRSVQHFFGHFFRDF